MYSLRWIFWTTLVLELDKGVSQQLYHELSKQIFVPPKSLPDEALFGYSVTYQPTVKRLIISSPKANNVGSIFRCDIERNECKQISVKIDPERPTETSHDYWLGATVKAGSNFFMACAPRQAAFKDRQIGTFGYCYTHDGLSDGPLMVSPQINDKVRFKNKPKFSIQSQKHKGITGYIEYKMDTFGWSMDATDNYTIAVGGPAMTEGRVMVYREPTTTPQLIQVEDSGNGDKVSFNFGYSIASGNFFNKDIYYAISSPYGDIGKGKVLFFHKDTLKKFFEVLLDNEVGSLFGAALCSLDLGGDRSYLLVGAPAFAPAGTSYDVGAVYLYYGTTTLDIKRTIIGYEDAGYFGNNIVSVGDLTGDSKDEVAISAPYENDGRGAVYLFSGADLIRNPQELPKIKWLQKIKPEGGANQNLGRSLSALQDYDDNGCKELAIGAPGNNSVLLFRCMASVTIGLHVVFPDFKKNEIKSHSSDIVFEVEPCLNVSYSEKPRIIDSVITVTVNAIHSNVSLDMKKSKTFTFSANLKERKLAYCQRVKVSLPLDSDYDQPILFNITAKLTEDPYKISKFKAGLVTLSASSVDGIAGSVSLPGSELSLNITTTMPDDYLIGSTNSENLTITLRNGDGSVAYGACVRVRISGVSVSRYPTTCSLDNGTLSCSTRGPLNKSKRWTGNVTLETTSMTSDSEKVEIHAQLLSHCSTPKGAPYVKTIALKAHTQGIVIEGKSMPDEIVNVTKTELNLEKKIEHDYVILNKGVTNWGALKCVIALSPHVKYSVSDSSEECVKTGTTIVECTLKGLKTNDRKRLLIVMELLLGTTLTDEIYLGNSTLTTRLDIFAHGGEKISGSITTVLKLLHISVPMWIIIVASLVGLLILMLIAFILYECGFLRRKNKEKLMELKKDIRRQTIRQTMKLRESMVAAVASQLAEDRQKLVDTSAGGGDQKHKIKPSTENTVAQAQIH